MKLLLTSTGLPTKNIKNKFIQMLGKKPEDTVLGFVPTAGYPEIIQKYVDEAVNPLKELNVKVKVIDIKEKTNEDLKKDFSDVDVIWVNGGNTFWLMYWVKRTGFDKVIKKHIKKGKLYVGVSAGSILVCPTIETSGWKGLDDPNVADLDNHNGLGLTDFNLFVHYEDKWKELVDAERSKLKQELVCLRDDDAVVVKDGRWKMVS